MLSRRAIFLIIMFIIIPFSGALADVKVFEKEVEEIVGRDQSVEQVEAFALQKAKRLAVEEAGTYISSLTVVQNFKLARDEITALASGLVKAKIIGVPSVTVINGVIHVRVRSRIQVDTSVLDQQIEAIMKEKGAIEKLEEERRKVKELEVKLASLKSTELRRLEELNRQAIALEMERENQRLFREEHRLKAQKEIAKADLDILNLEQDRMAYLAKLQREQEALRREELKLIDKEQDRLRKAHLKNESYWKELARKAEWSRANWIPIDDKLSLKQAIREAKDLRTEINDINQRLDLQLESSKENLLSAYRDQIRIMRGIQLPELAPKDPFETTAEYNQRIEAHERKAQSAKKQNSQRLEKLRFERDLEIAQLKVTALKQRVQVLKPFIERLIDLQARKFALPGEKVNVSLGKPDADSSRFPLDLAYKGKKWNKYWEYHDRKKARAFWMTRSHLSGQAYFQLEAAENNEVTYRFTGVNVTHLGTEELRVFKLVLIEDFPEVRSLKMAETVELPESERDKELLALAPQRKRIQGIWKTEKGVYYEITDVTGKCILTHKPRTWLNRETLRGIIYVGNNLWRGQIAYRHSSGRIDRWKDCSLTLNGETLTIQISEKRKNRSLTWTRAHKFYNDNFIMPLYGVWEDSNGNRFKIDKSMMATYVKTTTKPQTFLNQIKLHDFIYIADHVWKCENIIRHPKSGEIESFEYSILKLTPLDLEIVIPQKDHILRWTRIEFVQAET